MGLARMRDTMAITTYGSMNADREKRLDFDRLGDDGPARLRVEIRALPAYATATHIGTWA